MSLGTANLKRGAADINTPLRFLGERTGFRLNVMGHDSGVPGRDVVKNSRYGIAPTITFGLASPTRYTFNYSRLEQDNISDYGIPWVPVSNNVLADYRNKPAGSARDVYGYRDRDKEDGRGHRYVPLRARLHRWRACATSSLQPLDA
ncbi:MAG: hypothetical protein R2724_22885 [Bryobacterales bacterium]